MSSPLYYKSPLFGLELINRICGYTLFTSGVFNFSSLNEFAKQIRELLTVSDLYNKIKDPSSSIDLLKPRLFYATLDVLASSREIQYRTNCINVEIEKPKPLRINPYVVADDAVDNIKQLMQWFVDHFLNDNPFHQEYFSKVINWCVLSMDEREFLTQDARSNMEGEVIEYCKRHLFFILESELVSKSSFWGEKVFELVAVFVDDIDELKTITDFDELVGSVESIDTRRFLDYFDTAFTVLLDRFYSEVFHPLIAFDDVSFITKDWRKLKLQLVKRFNEGYKYGAILLDSNGNVGVGMLPEEYQILRPIEDPESQVYVLINESGIGVCKLVTWNEVIDGSAFSIRKVEGG
ncbi:MAG: hypothetical protein EOP04_08650 [Proteobacteria bacterium]|nr:MAG: hypothetical protein EOP04_08650 [Pseudomonadota bacterium]